MKVLFKMLSIIGAAVLAGLLTSFPIMWLWNGLMPEIFGLVKITFWQALGLSILSSFLLKSSSSSSSN